MSCLYNSKIDFLIYLSLFLSLPTTNLYTPKHSQKFHSHNKNKPHKKQLQKQTSIHSYKNKSKENAFFFYITSKSFTLGSFQYFGSMKCKPYSCFFQNQPLTP